MKLTTDSWTDGIGQTFEVGDYIAVSTINDRSPQTVIAQVISINLTNAEGQYYRKYRTGYPADAHMSDEAGVEAATVSAIPVYSCRHFSRWGKTKAVSYSVTENIVKLSDEQVAAVLEKVNANPVL